MTKNLIEQAAEIFIKSTYGTAFTGAGISIESGIPPFRGKDGIWNKYNPIILDIAYFRKNPGQSWFYIKEIFYDFFGSAQPNRAHTAVAELQEMEFIHTVITQNIDNLHQKAGSDGVIEFHGTSNTLTCIECGWPHDADPKIMNPLPPKCSKCHGVLKPDFIFFGEQIPKSALNAAINQSMHSDVFLIIGTTGEVTPANQMPLLAKEYGAKIIEVNTERSKYTDSVTDVFLQGKATEMMDQLVAKIKELKK